MIFFVVFWKDKWVDECKLMQLFPKLYPISSNHGRSVCKDGMWTSTCWQWCLVWRRNRYQWVIDQEREFIM